MSQKQTTVHTSRYRNFVPQLRERRDRFVYSGRVGAIGATPRSRYQLVGFSAVLTLLALIASALIHPVATAVIAVVVVALIAGGWPAATGVAELRRVERIYSHSTIILVSGLFAVGFALMDHGIYRLALLPAVAAVGIVASFIVELVRGEGSVGRLESVISCVSGVLAAISTAGWIAIADLQQTSRDTSSILLIGLGLALVIGAFGIRMISASPKDGPRRGAVTLGVTPVAFVGVVAYVIAISISPVIG
ncbi:hypothetical protein [Rothia aerolata]|uniref:Uncharacterized protein n=1 Tax=Rothia aerolata TaxID=1812262 RepID=A0A917IQI5_9MICC|nr:hypothetical protein [Rothia aerolata]GGH60778.1 hypothetical protein GCM10007359_09300 [Rothia aerolata]